MFKNKVIVITDGATDIGMALVHSFRDAGAMVIVMSKKKGTNSSEKDTRYFVLDITNEDEVRSAFSEIIKEFGVIDVIVNNANFNYHNQADIDTIQLEQYRNIVEINLTSILLSMKYAIPHLIPSHGSIINVTSQLGLVPEPKYPLYCAVKAAVVMLTKATAVHYAPRGVRINCVCQGPIDSPFIREVFPMAVPPIGRMGIPADIANVTRFLASDECSFVTGATYTVDGGSSLVRPHGLPRSI